MRGLPDFNFPAFFRVARELEAAGFTVWSPAENDVQKVLALEGYNVGRKEAERIAMDTENVALEFKDVMADDLKAVCESDAVILLPGWEWSEGAKLEVYVAHAVGVPVYTFPDVREIPAPVHEPHEFSSRWGDPIQGPSTSPEPGIPEPGIFAGDLGQLRHLEEMERLEQEIFPDARPRGDVEVPVEEIFGVDTLPSSSEARKALPVTTGVIDYFSAALVAVAAVSKAGNDKHNPGEPLHWSRGKSTDHADAIGRHLIDRGHVDPDTGLRHSAQLAWRALALLQEELEAEGLAPMSRASVAAL